MTRGGGGVVVRGGGVGGRLAPQAGSTATSRERNRKITGDQWCQERRGPITTRAGTEKEKHKANRGLLQDGERGQMLQKHVDGRKCYDKASAQTEGAARPSLTITIGAGTGRWIKRLCWSDAADAARRKRPRFALACGDLCRKPPSLLGTGADSGLRKYTYVLG